MLSLNGITMSFGGVLAVDDLSIRLERGAITGAAPSRPLFVMLLI